MFSTKGLLDESFDLQDPLVSVEVSMMAQNYYSVVGTSAAH